MKKSLKKRPRWPFILIVVFLLIFGVLLLAPAYFPDHFYKQGKLKLRAKNTLTSLVSAVDSYFNSYNQLPFGAGAVPSKDAIVRTDGDLMGVLVGSDIQGMNPKEVMFFSGVLAKGVKEEEAYNGLWSEGESAKLFDPWKKPSTLERGYLLLIDYDYDGQVEDPFRPGRVIERRVVAWSAGKDGKWVRGDPKKGVNKDNVFSWF